MYSLRSMQRCAHALKPGVLPSVKAPRAANIIARYQGSDTNTIETFKPTQEVGDHMAMIQQASTNQEEESLARVNFHPEAEEAINQQINVEYTNCYLYHAMACYFARDSVGLHGFAGYFREQSADERGHAQLFMDFLCKRGGRVKLAALSSPPSEFDDEKKGDALRAMELALALERLNFEKIRGLSAIAEKHEDPQMADFIDDMLQEQVMEVKTCADMVAQLRRIGKGYPVFEYDRYLSGELDAPPKQSTEQ